MRKTYITSRNDTDRKKNNKGSLIISIIFSACVLFLLIYFVKNSNFTDNPTINNTVSEQTLTWDESLEGTGLNEESSDSWYYIGTKVIESWIISWSTNLWLYTQVLILENWETLWLKSKMLDLSTYTWNVQIRWTVDDIVQWQAIIEIEDIVNVDNAELVTDIPENNTGANDDNKDEEEQDEDNEEKTEDWTDEEIVIKGKPSYTYSEYWLKLDFKWSTNYYTEQSNWNINIIDTTIEGLTWDETNTLISLSPFECEEWSPTKDCWLISQRFSLFESTINSNWVKFYKKPETNTWFFTINQYWFYVVPKDDSILRTMSQFIIPADNNDLSSKIKSNIKTICTKWDLVMTKANNIELTTSWTNKIATISWVDKDSNKLLCKVKIIDWNTLVTSVISLEKISKTDTVIAETSPNIVTIKEELKEIESQNNNTTIEDNPNEEINIEDIPVLNTNATMKISSSKWYTVYIPTNAAYKWSFVSPSESFWIAWLKCDYKLSAIYYKNSDLLDSNPQLELFYCDTSLDWSAISGFLWSENLIYKESTDWTKKIIIRYTEGNRPAGDSINLE